MKQYFTGFFTAVCLTASVFIFMGSRNKNLGDIEVNSIRLKTKNDKVVGVFSALNDRGWLMISNDNYPSERSSVSISVDEYGGNVRTTNLNGSLNTTLTTTEDGSGMVLVSNKDAKMSVGLAVSDEDGSVGIVICDKLGKEIWTAP